MLGQFVVAVPAAWPTMTTAVDRLPMPSVSKLRRRHKSAIASEPVHSADDLLNVTVQHWVPPVRCRNLLELPFENREQVLFVGKQVGCLLHRDPNLECAHNIAPQQVPFATALIRFEQRIDNSADATYHNVELLPRHHACRQVKRDQSARLGLVLGGMGMKVTLPVVH